MLPARTLLLLGLLLTCCLQQATGYSPPLECCDRYAARPIRHPRSFYRTPRGCSLPAVVIVAAGGQEICADPGKLWVKKALKRLGRRK
ncbi:C-C motif chemokine 17-like [Melanerpes formicivorus]|uniref:C-C motif chemokine 17-like n=1 Tax=Melanerpes formicivorus TaxID=211600 RepID=UPI00358F80DC